MVKLDLESKYSAPIKTALNKTEVNPYNQQPIKQDLKPMPKADFVPLNNFVKSLPKQGEYIQDVGIQAVKSVGRKIANIPSAITYSAEQKIPEKESVQVGFSDVKMDTPKYEPLGTVDLNQYKSVKDSMEAKYDYDYMPENTKKAYESVVDTMLKQDSFGKTYEEQRQSIQNLYLDKPMPEFVQKRLANIDSKETEHTLKLENARQNLVKMVSTNTVEQLAIEKKYENEPIIEGTKLMGKVMGSIIQMSPYMIASAAGGVGGVALSTIAGTGTMYVQVYTDAMAQALAEGATREQATEYGHVSAMIEAGTEMLSGGIPFAPKGILSSGIQGKIDDAVKIFVKDGTVRKFIGTAVDVFGEGAEEALAEYLGSMAMSIYKEDERSSEELTQDMIEAFVMGALTSATLQLGKVGVIKAAEKLTAEKAVDVQNIPIEQANKVMNDIALRSRVKNIDGLAYRLEEMPKGQNGYIDNRTNEIVLNKARVEEDGLIPSALSHEATHALEKVKGYDKLANFILQSKLETLDMSLAELKQTYQEKFNDIHEAELAKGNTNHVLEVATTDKMVREFVADFIHDNVATRPMKDAQGNLKLDSDGNILTYRNYDALLRLASNQPSAIQNIKKTIRRMIRKGKLADAVEYDQTTKAQALMMEEYLESIDGYLDQVLKNADKSIFDDYGVIEDIQYNLDGQDTLGSLKTLNTKTIDQEIQDIISDLMIEDAIPVNIPDDFMEYSENNGLGYVYADLDSGQAEMPNPNAVYKLSDLKKNKVDLKQLKDITQNGISIGEVLSASNIMDMIDYDGKARAWRKIEAMQFDVPAESQQAYKDFMRYVSNFVRDHREYTDVDTNGNVIPFNAYVHLGQTKLKDSKGRLKVFYYNKIGIDKNAVNYGYFISANPEMMDNPKEVYADVRKPLYDGNGQLGEMEFQLKDSIQGVMDKFAQDNFEIDVDLEGMRDAEMLKTIGDFIAEKENYPRLMEKFYKILTDETGFDAIDGGGKVMVFDDGQLYDFPEGKKNLLKLASRIQFSEEYGDYRIVLYDNDRIIYDSSFSSTDDVFDLLGMDLGSFVMKNIGESVQTIESFEGSIKHEPVAYGNYSNQVDNTNRQLTLGQAEYFKDSVVRDNDGRLKVVYHGTPGDFTEFGYDFMGSTGNAYGPGFYFTDGANMANSYTRGSGKIVRAYVDIKKPIAYQPIDKDILRDIIIEMAEAYDNQVLELYGDPFTDYEGTLEKTVEAYSKKLDYKVIDNLILDTSNDIEQALRIINKHTGIDGNITETMDGVVYVPFFPEQIKDINNPNPTSSRDIQYSIELDSTNRKKIDLAVSQFGLSDLDNGKYILTDGSVLKDGEVGLENILIDPKLNQAVVFKTPTNAQYEQLKAYFDGALGRQGDSIYLELHDANGKVIYKKYPIVSDLNKVLKDIESFYKPIQYSLDNKGRKLAPEQAEFFKNSKARDEQGNLVTLYHGTWADFNVFDISKAGESNKNAMVGFWFTESKEGAKRFGDDIWYGYTDKNKNEPNVIGAYLNIKNPKVYEKLDESESYAKEQSKLEDIIQTRDDLKNKMKNDYEIYDINNVHTYYSRYDLDTFKNNVKIYKGNIEDYYVDLKEYLKLKDDSRKQSDYMSKNFGYTDSYQQFRTDIYKFAGMTPEDANIGGLGMALKNEKEVVGKYRQSLIDEGYDGIIIKQTRFDSGAFGGDNNQYVAFFPEQIKKVDNLAPTESKDIRYSLDYDRRIYSTSLTEDEVKELDGLKAWDELVGITESDPKYNRYIKLLEKEKKIIKFKKLLDITHYDDIKKEYANAKKAYNNETAVYDAKILNSILSFVKGYRDTGKRTKQEWLEIAKQYGSQVKIQSQDELLNHALYIWFRLNPNNKNNLNRQGQSFVKFGIEEWIHSVANGAGAGAVSVDSFKKIDQTKNKEIDIVIKKEAEKLATSRYQQNALEVSNQEVKDNLEKRIANGSFSYVVVADRDSIERANAIIGDDLEGAYTDFKTKIASNLRMTKDDLVRGQLILKRMEKSRRTEEVVGLIQDIAILGTELGQQVQALSLIKRMTPEGKLLTTQRTLNRMKQRYQEEGKNISLEIPKEYQEFFVEAQARTMELEEQRQSLETQVNEIANLEAQIKELSSKLDPNIQAQYDDLVTQIKDLEYAEAEQSRLESKLEVLNKKLESYQGTSLESELQAVTERIKDTQAQIKENNKNLAKLTRLSQKYDSMLSGLESVDKQAVLDLNEKIKTVKKAERQLKKLIKENEAFTSSENIDAVMDEMKVKIAEQLPVGWEDLIRNFRYLSMLGNARTHVRNVLGNLFFVPLVFSRDVLSVGLQQFVPEDQRTKVIFASKEAIAFAENDYLANKKEFSGVQKYDMQTEIERQRRIFDNDLLEWLRIKNFDLLEIEDDIFVGRHYSRQLAKYLTAQKIDPNTATEEQLVKARAYAIEEARKATFKDESKVADALNKLTRMKNKKGKQTLVGIAVEAVIPFKKTPINIIKRGVEYSPIGLVQGITSGLNDVKSGRITSTEFIDKISAGLTGTGIALAGALIYSLGFIEIGNDDEETKRVYGYMNALGRQRYSLKIGEHSYSIDWIAPAIMPFILGATIQKVMTDDSEAGFIDAVWEGALDIMDPIFELTMLQGVTDTLQSFQGGGAAMVGESITTMAANYANQFIPTILGQIARTVDPIQRSTQPDATGTFSKFLETTARKIGNKIPYVSMMNAPVITSKGETVSASENPFMRAFLNMVSPGYYKKENIDVEDVEILKLYELTKDTSVLPRTAEKYFRFDNETIRLGNEGLSNFQETMGKKSYDLLGELIKRPSFDNMDDNLKIEIMSEIYDFAYDQAKDEYLTSIGKSYTEPGYLKTLKAQRSGINVIDYLLAKNAFAKMSGDDKKEQFITYLKAKKIDVNTGLELIGGYKVKVELPDLNIKGLKKLK